MVRGAMPMGERMNGTATAVLISGEGGARRSSSPPTPRCTPRPSALSPDPACLSPAEEARSAGDGQGGFAPGAVVLFACAPDADPLY